MKTMREQIDARNARARKVQSRLRRAPAIAAPVRPPPPPMPPPRLPPQQPPESTVEPEETVDITVEQVKEDAHHLTVSSLMTRTRAELVMMCATRMLDTEGTKRELATRIVESGQ